MTAAEIARQAREAKPHVRYAYSIKEDAVAAFADGRWIPVAGLGIDGRWYSMSYEILANGKPMHEQSDWIEVEGGAL